MKSKEAQKMQAARDALKKRYRGIYDRISSILFRIDPMGINFEDNTDEYDPETDTILPRLGDCNSTDDVRVVVVEEFRKWFDADMVNSGNRIHFDKIAAEIWSEVQIFREASQITKKPNKAEMATPRKPSD